MHLMTNQTSTAKNGIALTVTWNYYQTSKTNKTSDYSYRTDLVSVTSILPDGKCLFLVMEPLESKAIQRNKLIFRQGYCKKRAHYACLRLIGKTDQNLCKTVNVF